MTIDRPPGALPRRRIGRTALDVSVMAVGAAPLGGLYRASSQQDALDTLRAALAGGINFIDVAPLYGEGLAERRVGKSLAQLPTGGLVLSTKVGRLLEPTEPQPLASDWAEGLPFAVVYDTSPDAIRRSLRDSIERLGGARPSILLLHDPDRSSEPSALPAVIKEAYQTMAELRAEGAVTAIGLGVNAPGPCRIALELGDWDCFLLANSYSVLFQGEEGLLDTCRQRGISVFIGGPYMSGALAGGSQWRQGPITESVSADIERLKTVCSRYGLPLQAAALQFPLRHPAVASVIVGMRAPAEVSQNISFLTTSIPDAFWDNLAAAGFIPR